MIALNLTKHAKQRLSQRGLIRQDVETLFGWGEAINDQEIIIKKKDVASMKKELESEIKERKDEINRLNKIAKCKIVHDGAVIISAYHTTRREQRKIRLKLRTVA